MATEFITDKNPQYIHNTHTTYENTVLQEHSAIVSGLRDTNTNKSMVEVQGRLLIGMCKKEETEDFINRRFNAYYKEEFNKTATSETTPDRHATAVNRTWLRLITEAMSTWIPKYKVDGCKAKIAVIDDVLADGRKIIDLDDRMSLIRDLLPEGYKIVKPDDTTPLPIANNIEPVLITDNVISKSDCCEDIIDFSDEEEL